MGTRRQSFILGMALGLILALVSCVLGIMLMRRGNEELRPITLTRMASSQATAEAETALTQAYGEEVSRIIENYEIQSHSLEFVKGMGIGSEITTGYFYRVYGDGVSMLERDSVWMVVTAAEVDQVRVIEYTPERIKAVARVDRIYDNQTPDGSVVEASLSDYSCGVYVFAREDGLWKLAGFFLTTDRRSAGSARNDWLYANSDLKQTIGDLPEGDLCP